MSMKVNPRGPQAARLRKKKFEILRTLEIPEEALPGSLALTHRRCGKPSCHCVRGEGHPVWTLTFMVAGKKRVERVPLEWLDEVSQLVEDGREFREATAVVFAANAELLFLWRRQARK